MSARYPDTPTITSLRASCRKKKKIPVRAREDDEAEIAESARMQIHRHHGVFYMPTTCTVQRGLAFLVLLAFTPMHRTALCATVIVSASPSLFPSLPQLPRPIKFSLLLFFFTVHHLSSSSTAYFYPLYLSLSFTRGNIIVVHLSFSLPLPLPYGLSLFQRDGLSFRKDARIALSRAAFNSRR